MSSAVLFTFLPTKIYGVGGIFSLYIVIDFAEPNLRIILIRISEILNANLETFFWCKTNILICV